MNKKFVCTISKEETDKMQDANDMLNAIESLTNIIAKNNEVILEDSVLYNRLIEDTKKYKGYVDSFWKNYMNIYKELINHNTQLILDYKTCEISIVSITI